MQKEIRHTWMLPHAPEKVWEFLTNPEIVAKWLMPNDFQPVVGHKFMFHSKPLPQFNFDGEIFCEVLELTPPKTLSYSWKGGPGNGEINLDTIVYWTLTPKGKETELLLVHAGFDEDANALIFAGMNAGWGSNIAVRFAALLNEAGQ